MKIYIILIICLVLIFLCAFILKNKKEIDQFVNYLPIIKTYKCYSKNRAVINFVDDMNKIMT